MALYEGTGGGGFYTPPRPAPGATRAAPRPVPAPPPPGAYPHNDPVQNFPDWFPPQYNGPPPDAGPQSDAAPDWGNDPNVAASLAQQQMGNSQLDSALKAARERAIINFGDPAMADMAGFGLDPQAATFARQNYLSGNAGLARIDKSHDLARQAVINKLVSHGLLGSGDLGYLEGEENTKYGQNTFDARQKLLGYLSDLYQNYLDRKQSLSHSLLGAYQQAYSTMLQNY